MAHHNDLGKKGEDLAADFLEGRGLRVIARNWTGCRHEIDIVAVNSDFIIFVEVKTRCSDYWGRPEDAISKSKMKRMIDAASYYLETSEIDLPVRFDIVSIMMSHANTEIEHIEDAFLPSCL